MIKAILLVLFTDGALTWVREQNAQGNWAVCFVCPDRPELAACKAGPRPPPATPLPTPAALTMEEINELCEAGLDPS